MVAYPILVVDDDPTILDVIHDLLTLEGYEVETARNGLEALRMVEHSRPALVLLDMRMPLLDGWGFARELEQRGIHIPILVLTATSDAARWAHEIGAIDYLAKPFEISSLLDSVERNLAA
jgi:two-component system, chemotaxis family, chemotaxis protein CheY